MTEPRIRVLVADDSALQRLHMSELIADQPDMDVVGSAGSGHDAVRRAAELQPDVVLMDIHMPDLDGIQATWQVSTQVPNGAVIMVTSEERIDFLQKAMSAGAAGYVLKPFGSGEQLLQSIRDAHRRTQGRRVVIAHDAPAPQVLGLGTRIAVLGTKGGVGGTTVAVALALALRRRTKQSVVLFDGDVQLGDAALHLGISGTRSVLDLLPNVDALDSALLAQVLLPHPSGIGFLDRPARPELAEALTGEHIAQLSARWRALTTGL